ncbi:CYTH and CHAD domain-containing protein [Arthrobacter sp. OVS8]|nr:CYTH and CHAD domain-containing protein [Arthrobacter sp. OVS8]
MAATRVVEIERKFDVEEEALLPSPQDLPGVARVDRPVEHRLEAEYFDTEDLRLASARITLRRRTGGEDAGWHLKLPAGVDERTEFREQLGGQAGGVPDALLGLVRVHTRDRALVPVARLKTRRLVYRLRDKNNAVLAEFCDDRVQSETLGPIPGTRTWREWEIELVAGSRALLESVQDRIAGAGVRPSAYQSKLARALNLDPATTEPAPKRKGPAGDVLLAYLRQQVKELKDQDPRVRQDTHDAVHKMRVATRRMRSALATYQKLLDDAETVTLLRNELKWLAGVLGQARDAEVMHARLKDMVAEEPGELVMGPVARRVDLELGGAYQEAHAKALEALDGQRYFRLLDALEAMIAAPPSRRWPQSRRSRSSPTWSNATSSGCAPRPGKPSVIPPVPVTTWPSTRPARSENACGTQPKPLPPSTPRRPPDWPTPPRTSRRS